MMTNRPFPFVVARGRSGTTLLRAILDSHPELAIPGESHFAVGFTRNRVRYEPDTGFDRGRFLHDLFRHVAFKGWGLAESDVRAAFAETPPDGLADAIRLVYAAYARSKGKPRWGDKTPGFVLHIGLIAELLPEARFLHLIRDGRDVALSYLDADFGVESLTDGAIYWDRFVRQGRRAGQAIGPNRYMELRYEDLVSDTESTIRRVCEFIELTFDPEMLTYFQRVEGLHAGLYHAQQHTNLFKPPTTGLRDWRRDMSPRDVALFEALAGDLLSDLGYERANPRPSLGTRSRAARARVAVLARRAARGTRKRRDPDAWLGPKSRRARAIAAQRHSDTEPLS